MNHKFIIYESAIRLPGITPDLPERFNRLPVKLAALLDDPKAKITIDENKKLLTIESFELSPEDVFFSVEKSVRGLNLSFSTPSRSSFFSVSNHSHIGSDCNIIP